MKRFDRAIKVLKDEQWRIIGKVAEITVDETGHEVVWFESSPPSSKSAEEITEEQLDKDVEATVQHLKGFSKGYQACIEDLRLWNGDDASSSLPLHNHLITMEKKFIERCNNLSTPSEVKSSTDEYRCNWDDSDWWTVFKNNKVWLVIEGEQDDTRANEIVSAMQEHSLNVGTEFLK